MTITAPLSQALLLGPCSFAREQAVLPPLYAGTGPYGVAARRLAL